jgi:hypothetical protein
MVEPIAYSGTSLNGRAKPTQVSPANPLPVTISSAFYPYSYSATTKVDKQIAGAAAVLHTVTFSCDDAGAAAGTIIIYDSLTESGTIIFQWAVPAAYFEPFTLTFNCNALTGIYVGFTTTNDVNVAVSYALA